MKWYHVAKKIFLVCVGLILIGSTIFFSRQLWHLVDHTSYRFVYLFLLLILISNLLAKLALDYVQTGE